MNLLYNHDQLKLMRLETISQRGALRNQVQRETLPPNRPLEQPAEEPASYKLTKDVEELKTMDLFETVFNDHRCLIRALQKVFLRGRALHAVFSLRLPSNPQQNLQDGHWIDQVGDTP